MQHCKRGFWVLGLLHIPYINRYGANFVEERLMVLPLALLWSKKKRTMLNEASAKKRRGCRVVLWRIDKSN